MLDAILYTTFYNMAAAAPGLTSLFQSRKRVRVKQFLSLGSFAFLGWERMPAPKMPIYIPLPRTLSWDYTLL